MHAANEKMKAAEDQKKAQEMEVSIVVHESSALHMLINLQAMHAAQEKAKAEEDQKKAKEMEVRLLISHFYATPTPPKSPPLFHLRT
jgi:hypothetical protein